MKATATKKQRKPIHAARQPVKNASQKKPVFQAPKGFTFVSNNGMSVSVDWDATPIVEGKVTEIKDIKLKPTKENPNKSTRLMTVDTKELGEVGVWEKAQLTALFDAAEVGSVVWIAHTGTKVIKGRPLPMHEFITYIK